MALPILAEIDWPIMILTIVILCIILTARSYRKLAREANLAYCDGDMARSLNALMRLHRSKSPVALLTRWMTPGTHETVIAVRHARLHEFDQTRHWAELGLKKAKKPLQLRSLHSTLATVAAVEGDIDRVESHLQSLKSIQPESADSHIACRTTAAASYHVSGRLDLAMQIIHDNLGRLQTAPQFLQAVAAVMYATGQFEGLLSLTNGVIQAYQARGSDRHQADPLYLDRRIAIGEVHKAEEKRWLHEIISAGLGAAEATEQWDLYEHYLTFASCLATPGLQAQHGLQGYEAILAAHRADRDQVEQITTRMRETIAKHPRDGQLKLTANSLLAAAWLRLGEPALALEQIDGPTPDTIAPITRSSMANTRADCLERMGRADEARQWREEARQLAPLAFWNRQPSPDSADFIDEIPMATFTSPGQHMPPPPRLTDHIYGPVPPVASGLACAAWPLAVCAMIPIVGTFAATALLVLCGILFFRKTKLADDRRVATAGFVLAILSIFFASLTIVNWLIPVPDVEAAHWLDDETWFTPEQEEAIDDFLDSEEAENMSDEEIDERLEAIVAEHEPPPHTDREDDKRWIQITLLYVVLVVSIILHEIAHGVAAYWGGDPTARDHGRFSLNPFRHLSWLGSVFVPLLLAILPGDAVIGWAKPVPVQVHRLRKPRRGFLGVSLAGVSINLLLALIASNVLTIILIAFIRIHPDAPMPETVCLFEHTVTPGASNPLWGTSIDLCKMIILVNAILLGFNLLPIPPLDGFNLLRSITPRFLAPLMTRLAGTGFLVLLILIAFNLLYLLLMPAIYMAIAMLVLPRELAIP